MLETAHAFIDKAAKQLGLPEESVSKIKKINNQLEFEIKLKNGKTFKAYRIQHNNNRGPYKGGIRFHPNVSLDEVQTLATLMSLKTAAVGLPLGGGKGGVIVDPKELSAEELEELSREYVRNIHKHIGPDKDVPAPDVNTTPQIMDWMVDEYQKLTGDTTKATFTGKSLTNGGSMGRDAATGRGGVIATVELLNLIGEKKNVTYAVQGFGNVGSFFAITAKELAPNWRLVAASDSETAVYNPEGLNVDQIFDFKAKGGRFKDYDSATSHITNEELIALEVDILVLAGLEDSVSNKNMSQIKSRYVIEMANGPVTAEAYDYLVKKGKIVLPDIVANAGGVIVSYLEWCQNLANEKWSVDKVNDQLKDYMTKATKGIYEYAKKHDTDLKNAAFVRAIDLLS